MNHNFTESELEKAALEWFDELEYEIAFGPDLAPGGDYAERESYADVLLEERIRDALRRINPNISADTLCDAYRQIAVPQNPSLIMNNRTFQKMLTDGIDVQVKQFDGMFRTEKVYVIDFEDPSDNEFLALNQYTVEEHGINKRPDIVVFINGLPLVVLELKSASNEEVNITDAYNQIQTYQITLPSLFTYNAFNVISDGINARVGTLTSNEDRYMMWRTIDGEDVASNAMPQLEVLIRGMFEPTKFLDIIRYFILFQDDGAEISKILAGYHQYHAVNKAVENTERATDYVGDRRIGVIWHTQGSGKSLSMVFYAGKLVINKELENPTIVVITDRNDLDDQLYNTFTKSKELLRNTPVQVKSRTELRDLLNNRTSGGIIFTTIHKFAPMQNEDQTSIDEEYLMAAEENVPYGKSILSDRKNIIVIADEAHRSQYGFGADVVKDENEADVKYGYAKYMRESLPNASYIGFTGTPIATADRNTRAVFGDYIDVYDMTRAVEDGTTVRIYYESRIALLKLDDAYKSSIDDEYEEITEAQEYTQKEKLKSKWARLEAIVGAKDRVQLIAKDIVEHFNKREEAQENIGGKGMIVAMSRRIAVELYRDIIALCPEWHSDDLMKGKIKVVMTGSSSDPVDWQQHVGTKTTRETLAKRMKDVDDELKLVIVRDMWLTGFDVPSLHTMYVDKPMNGHSLMQAIARVNRVFREKQGGLVVDYIGIAENLKKALFEYTEQDRDTAGIDTEQAVNILLEKYDLIKEFLHGHDYSKFFSDKKSDKMKAIAEAMDFVIGKGEERKKDYLRLVVEMSKAYSLCSTTIKAIKLNLEVAFHKAVKSAIVKLMQDQLGKTSTHLDAELDQLVSKSISSDEIIDVLGEAGLSKQNIGILSDEFLEEVKNMKHKNLAVELLNRLLKGQIKVFARRNLVQSKKFSEMLDASIRKYQNRTIETTMVIVELIEMAKQLSEADKRGETTGLSEDELAFYDALAENQSAKDVIGDEILKEIAIELTRSIRNSITVDWSVRSSVQAKMRMLIRRLLKKYKYPPDKAEGAIELVMRQTQLMCENLST